MSSKVRTMDLTRVGGWDYTESERNDNTMKRADKYPNTFVFTYHNENPKNKYTTDCVIRAIATACEKPYNEVVMDAAKVQIETGYDPSDNKGIDILMKRYGWTKMKQPKREDGTKYTGKDFCIVQQRWCSDSMLHGAMYGDGIEISSRIVANIGGNHTVAIINGKVLDVWDSTDGCIGNYWIKV